MRGWVSGFVLVGLGAGLGWLGVLQLGAALAGGAYADAAPLAVLGAMIAFVPASVFAGMGAGALRRSIKPEDDVVEAFATVESAPIKAVVIPFPRGRLQQP